MRLNIVMDADYARNRGPDTAFEPSSLLGDD